MRGLFRLALLAALLPLPVLAQSERKSAGRGQAREEPEGFWPSEKIIELALTRWADEAAAENELDEEQTEQLRERMLGRWPKFLRENRTKIQPVLNEFIEMRLEREPPSKERVQDWADRAAPVFDMFREQINHGIEEFRETLNPLQKAKFEKDVLEFSAGMQVADAKLKQWKRGEFEEREFWDPPPAERRRRRAEREAQERDRAEQAAHEAAQAAKDPITQEVDRWDAFVAEVIRAYDFDDAQRNTAQSCLKELKERAIAYRDRNRDQIARLEGRIAAVQQRNAELQKARAAEGGEKSETDENPDAATDEGGGELAEVKQQLADVYGPIDEMFQELKRRVEGIPTREQRERFEKGQTEQDKKRERGGKEPATKQPEKPGARPPAEKPAEPGD